MDGRTAGKMGVDTGIGDRYSMHMGGGQRDGRTEEFEKERNMQQEKDM